MKRVTFPVLFEKSDTGYGAYSPDVPGCIAVGDTLEETRQMIKEALEFHLEGMLKYGDLPLPKPTSHAEDVTITMPQVRRSA